ncbi:MAG: hypothetical protein JO261_12515 [Alphaproteobacteria bacterium]|nr:hypothetical protein [Alphaproteobacteria bacterium]MBV9694513.1 hypothetical protein [Alphaproteobacteria bacterium]
MNQSRKKLIERYDLDFLREEYCRRFGRTTADFEEAARALRTFFTLVSSSTKPLAITSEKVDDLWHMFILFTPQYREFCDKFFGRYIDHQPNTDRTPVPASALLNLYQALDEQFGEVDDFWLRDLPISVQASLLRNEVPDVTALKWSGWTGV